MSLIKNMRNDLSSYQQLASLYHAYSSNFFTEIPIEMRNWFSANMASALGAVLDKLIENLNSIKFNHIDSAVQDRHTTKTEVTGGLGLAILREFVIKNMGIMQIVSDDGFYEYGHQGEKALTMSAKFPGTIVNLQFCTNDRESYLLASELDLNNIF